MNAPGYSVFLEQVVLWAAAQSNVQAVVLVGSCARDSATLYAIRDLKGAERQAILVIHSK